MHHIEVGVSYHFLVLQLQRLEALSIKQQCTSVIVQFSSPVESSILQSVFIRRYSTTSGMHGLGSDYEMEDQGFVLPGCMPYVSLAFKLITTMAILFLSSWVVYTIKTTRSLHKPHNIFVANLLIYGMIIATAKCFISGTMIVSSAVGVESIVN